MAILGHFCNLITAPRKVRLGSTKGWWGVHFLVAERVGVSLLILTQFDLWG